jgi:nucleoside-diphosphate-sugar epimerase
VFLLEKLRHGVEVFNYVDEPQMTTHDLVSLIARKAGRSKPKLSIPMGIAMPAARLMDMIGSAIGHDFTITSARIRKFNTSTQFSVEKLRSMGFKAPFTIEEGLERNIRWYMDQPRIQPELSALRSVESGE